MQLKVLCLSPFTTTKTTKCYMGPHTITRNAVLFVRFVLILLNLNSAVSMLVLFAYDANCGAHS